MHGNPNVWIVLFLQFVVGSLLRAEECLFYSVGIDGSGLKLEVDGGLIPEYVIYGSPDLSPNGQRLVFDATPQNGGFHQTKILIIDLDGNSKGQVEDFDCGNCPAWSPDGQRIAFSVNQLNPTGFARGIWIINADGSDPKWICEGRLPRWVPDGKSLIVSNRSGTVLSKVVLSAEEGIPFLEGYSFLDQIRWSPDGKRVLAHIQGKEVDQLVTIDPNGGKESVIVLASGPLGEHCYFAYSPDGKWVSFVKANNQGGNDIFLVETDGKTQPKKIDVIPNVTKEDFCWMKDSQRILFNASGKIAVESK